MSLAPLYTSASVHWRTPDTLYRALFEEFGFTLDPCPLMVDPMPLFDGLARSWLGERVYCNPPYGKGVARWLEKRHEAALVVYQLPARTDTRWWHEHAMKASEIRFLRGRLAFPRSDGIRSRAPFPSVLLIYRP